MAYSATLANSRKLISDTDHRRILDLFSRAGLSMDHPQFDSEILEKGTAAILKTRDGLLRAAVPSPLGQCKFINDVDQKEMNAALLRHKKIMRNYPRAGEGLEAYVDASDTGYTENNDEATAALEEAAKGAGDLNDTNGIHAGSVPNGQLNGSKGLMDKIANGAPAENGLSNGMNGFVNGARS